jgi:hypothetical protein
MRRFFLLFLCGALPVLAGPPVGRTVVLDSFEAPAGWTTVGGGTLEYSESLAKEEAHSLIWKAPAVKARNSACGIERTGLKQPLPDKLSFWVYPERGAFLFVGLSDSQGNRVMKTPIPGLQVRQWNLVELTPKTMTPALRYGQPLTDLDGIFIGTEDGCGEYPATGVYPYYLDGLTAWYPAAAVPAAETTARRAALDAKLAQVKAKAATLDALLARAAAAGLDTRYPRVSRTVMGQFVLFAAAEATEGKLDRAHRQADFLLATGDRSIGDLQQALAQPQLAPRAAAAVPMQNLVARHGKFYSGDRPVLMVGLCGWWDTASLPVVAATGFNCISTEVGPAGVLKSAEATDPAAIQKVVAVMTDAQRQNLAVDLLLSPHYFPDWAYETYAGVDEGRARRNRNPFMPWDVSSPDFRRVLARYLGVILPEVRRQPALVSYDLVNEAWYETLGDLDPAAYAEWARTARKDHPFWTSLNEFNKARVVEFFAWYAAAVHQYDTAHPVWAKVIGNQEVMGIDREGVGDVLDANGADHYPQYPDPSGRYAADLWSQAIMQDSYRSFQPDKVMLDGEYHLIPYSATVSPPEYITTALWHAHLHGRDFSAIWVWGREIENELNGFYTQPWCVEAAGKTALDLQRLAEQVTAFSAQPAAAAVFYGGTDFQRAYEAMTFLDAPFDLISEKRIAMGKLGNYKLLVLPTDAELSAAAQVLVKRFTAAGGRVFRCAASGDERQLSRAIDGQYDAVQVARPVRAGVFGVELRSAVVNGRTCAYLINLNREPATIRLQTSTPVTARLDLISRKPVAPVFTLPPLSPLLLELR